MNSKTKFFLLAIITGITGIIYTFFDYKFLKNSLKLSLGLQHNSHIMLGTLALIIAIVAFAKFILFLKNRE